MDAVCFDMDGVVVDSESYWVPLQREELLPAVVPDEPVAVEEITGMNYREIYSYLDDTYETAMDREAFLDRFDGAAVEIYGERVALLDGLAELLAALRDRGVAVALVSSAPHHWIDIVRDRFDLDFDAVVSADDVSRGKPAPDVYQQAATELGVDPTACVAVEDSTHGVAAARAAGMTVVGFAVGDHDGGDWSGADHVADQPADLRSLLLDLASS